jgi:hypothetical protein
VGELVTLPLPVPALVIVFTRLTERVKITVPVEAVWQAAFEYEESPAAL